MKNCENCKKRSLYVDNGSSLIVRITAKIVSAKVNRLDLYGIQ